MSGDDVYVGGYEVISGVRRAKIWKNGKLRYTFPQNTIEMVYEIAVQGTDIYVVGYPTAHPVYWKISATNETSMDVPLLDWAHGITVKGNDVYVSGNKGNKARYVKNGSAVDLTDGTNYAYCNSIFLSGNDVYAVGSEEKSDGTDAPKYWKNSTAISLTSGNSNTHGNSIFVWNSKVYVAGADEDAPYLWEDGKQQKLANEGAVSAVFVVDRP
ncbi:hypothetical protein GCM10011386_47000 [Parapedobacter defluvii]|uniref:Uncharacterized protein n=1 Tax=Parapedobacter defluvii TaxID=2045106 RepID=A0ABQ1N323_9SPHI|nr:hypothetical protein [Parapedobacter defluvii]GGC49306.1 hypothetical protein GCM10011386_47000 [Parapedobacter defluvii]